MIDLMFSFKVLLQYTCTNGIEYSTLRRLYAGEIASTEFESVPLPVAARSNGVRLRWIQLRHEHDSKADWTLDSIYIGGDESAPAILQDGFSQADMTSSLTWIETGNVITGTYCDRRWEIKLKNYDV